MQCRIPVKSNLNPGKLHLYFQDYWDQQLVDLLTYRFLLDFRRDKHWYLLRKTTPPSLLHATHVNDHTLFNALIGPFHAMFAS